jgi:hypothetical protein
MKRLSDEKVATIMAMHFDNIKQCDIAEVLNVAQSTVSRIIKYELKKRQIPVCGKQNGSYPQTNGQPARIFDFQKAKEAQAVIQSIDNTNTHCVESKPEPEDVNITDIQVHCISTYIAMRISYIFNMVDAPSTSVDGIGSFLDSQLCQAAIEDMVDNTITCIMDDKSLLSKFGTLEFVLRLDIIISSVINRTYDECVRIVTK